MVIEACKIGEIQHLMREYLEMLSSPFDSFLEEHILSSTFYIFRDAHNDIGYMATYSNDRLTQFYIRRSHLKLAQQLFIQVIKSHMIHSIFVPTSDEQLISLVIDHEFVIRKQAYLFQDSLVNSMKFSIGNGEVFRSAIEEDLNVIRRVCGQFLDDYESRITNGELFVYYRNADLLGIGLIERSHLFKEVASIGMFVSESSRNQGVGRTIIVGLRDWCNNHDIKPISGCWYYNEASKRTLESGGMVTKTRLLNVEINLV
ncbi:GNAT family N-acetyltransferase [Neobacillus mesonae]|nr:GNAT family N-acetyltransferase [Neobacillus mesonae]